MPRALALLCFFFWCPGVWAQASEEWSEPFPPHRVIQNVYYVGSKGLASYLITTPAGHILINSNLESSPPLIEASIAKLGFRLSDVKILLISHAHWDHCAGSARLKAMTKAQYMVMDADVPVVESGGKADFQYGNSADTHYPAVKVDRVLKDGSEVRLGGVTLVAHKTAGHTKGCTTWSLKVSEGGKTQDVVIVGSPNVNSGYRLVHNPAYPEMAADYEHGFRTLQALHCDVFLGAHGSYYDMVSKYGRLPAGSRAAVNPFIDAAGYHAYLSEREAAFRAEWKKQLAQAQ